MRHSTMIRMAYNAMERDTFSTDPEVTTKAEEAMKRLHHLSESELVAWVGREQEYRSLTSVKGDSQC